MDGTETKICVKADVDEEAVRCVMNSTICGVTKNTTAGMIFKPMEDNMEIVNELMPYLNGILEKKKNCTISLYKENEDFILNVKTTFKNKIIKSKTSFGLIVWLRDYLKK
jgi:hypothetical protein